MVAHYKVKFLGMLRKITGEEEKERVFESSITIEKAIQDLVDLYGKKFRDELFDGSEISEQYIILLNGKSVKIHNSKTKLKEGDVITIVPGFSLAGG
jgi:MoaD family protein